jgi:DNA-binding transcriptional ArsR family regulator
MEPKPPADEDPTMTANALKAMAHPLRWKILCTLGDRELSVGEIVEQTNRIYYRIRNGKLLELVGTMRSVLCPANLDDRYPGN